jgi:hypothetical protein
MNTSADHEAYLRAALHAAADSLEPRGDGLERIRVRLQRRPRPVAWLLAAGDALRLRAPVVLQVAFYQLSAGFSAAWDRFAPDLVPGKHRSRAQGWLRPLAAMAAVIFIVAAGTYVAIDVSTAVSPSSHTSNPRGGGGQPAGGTSHPSATATPLPTHSVAGSGTPSRHASPLPSATCGASATTASPSCQASTSASPSPSASVSPTPTPSVSPSDSSSPSPTPSASDSTGTGD